MSSRIARLALAALLALSCAPAAVRIPSNQYGLAVVKEVETYNALVRREPHKALVDLKTAVPSIEFDVRYATDDNFMKRRLYATPAAFLRCEAARALRDAQLELLPRGLGLKVFDAYRPYSVTEMMWEPYKDPDYVADPAKGSRHNRGAAVDLTLVRLSDGSELDMGTGYDDFTPRAAHGFSDLPDEVKENRELLRSLMGRHGFDPLPSEWWHYDFRGWETFELMDLPHAVIPSAAGCAM